MTKIHRYDYIAHNWVKYLILILLKNIFLCIFIHFLGTENFSLELDHNVSIRNSKVFYMLRTLSTDFKYISFCVKILFSSLTNKKAKTKRTFTKIQYWIIQEDLNQEIQHPSPIKVVRTCKYTP